MSLFKELKQLNKVCQKPNYKKAGNWMVRNIIRDACVPMTYILLKTPITANQVTLLSLLLGIGGCAVFLAAQKLSFLWLAVLLQLSYYFDHVDGQIARCKNQASLSGLMFDFICHYIIFGAVFASLGLKAYFEGADLSYFYYGIVASISIISFNLLVDSKYRAFFIEILKHGGVKIRNRSPQNSAKRKNPAAVIFSFIHKSCEMHVIINTVTVVAILQLFGLEGFAASCANITWAQVLAAYYGIACLGLAVVKTYFFITTKRADKEFEDTFLIEE